MCAASSVSREMCLVEELMAQTYGRNDHATHRGRNKNKKKSKHISKSSSMISITELKMIETNDDIVSIALAVPQLTVLRHLSMAYIEQYVYDTNTCIRKRIERQQ